MKRNRILLGMSVVALGALGGSTVLFADGPGGPVTLSTVPSVDPLVYVGDIADESGPLEETVEATIRLIDRPTPAPDETERCSRTAPTLQIVGGRFELPFADECAGVIIEAGRDDQALWVELTLVRAGTPTIFPRSRLRAVPYALSAAYAGRAHDFVSEVGLTVEEGRDANVDGRGSLTVDRGGAVQLAMDSDDIMSSGPLYVQRNGQELVLPGPVNLGIVTGAPSFQTPVDVQGDLTFRNIVGGFVVGPRIEAVGNFALVDLGPAINNGNICFLIEASSNGLERHGCSVHVLAGRWQLLASAGAADVAFCAARCLTWAGRP